MVAGLVVQAQPAEHSRRLVELDLGDLVLHSYDLLHSRAPQHTSAQTAMQLADS